jgi:hypothetical protein
MRGDVVGREQRVTREQLEQRHLVEQRAQLARRVGERRERVQLAVASHAGRAKQPARHR